MDFDYARTIIRDAMRCELESSEGVLGEATRYAATGTGKLYRPLMTISAADAYGVPFEKSVRFGTAIELGHAGSLVLDDAADKSEIRRGEPSCWRKYGRGLANVVATKLVIHAVDLVAKGSDNPEINMNVLKVMNHAALITMDGQIEEATSNGQYCGSREMGLAGKKTGALFAGAAMIGGIVGNASFEEIALLENVGRSAGIFFQIKDDIYDVEGDPLRGGKPTGQDSGKNNLARRIGVEPAKKIAERYKLLAERCAACLPGGGKSLVELIDEMYSR